MRFPPPARYFVPLLVLLFGLAITWLDYELNLANDLERNLADVRDFADSTGDRLTKLARKLLPKGELDALESDLASSSDQPWIEFAALVDGSGKILADSDGRWKGVAAERSPAASAIFLTKQTREAAVTHSQDGARLFGAYPVPASEFWIVLVFDRADAMRIARRDASNQLRWIASATGLLCFSLWAMLHFGFASRIAALANSVRSFGAGSTRQIPPLRGTDEVAGLSAAFAAMAARVQAQESERAQLEREILETSERERRSIGRDLHDGLGQRLTAASMAAEALASDLGAVAPEVSNRASGLAGGLRAAIAEARQLSHGLAPPELSESGLVLALASLVESARGAGTRAVLECPAEIVISNAAAATHLFRIAQEAVTNALKHARPGEIRIGLEMKGSDVVLEVEDDGCGMPETAQGEGIGLRVMRHRANLLGGKIEILASAAGGTLVRCCCPLAIASAK